MLNPRLLVKSLHDIRAKILFAFLFAGHAMTIKELECWTGSPRQSHYKHLDGLCADGLLAKYPPKAHGEKIYGLGSEMLPALQSWAAQLGQGTPELEGGPMLLDMPALQLSSFATPAVEPIQYESLDASFEKNMAACRRVGIGYPMNERLSKMPHVSPRLIIDHVESLVPGETIGLAIRRIEGNEMPARWLEEIDLIPRPEVEIPRPEVEIVDPKLRSWL